MYNVYRKLRAVRGAVDYAEAQHNNYPSSNNIHQNGCLLQQTTQNTNNNFQTYTVASFIMGNSASEPISALECQKYGISVDEIHEYNAVVEKVKKKSRAKGGSSSSTKGGAPAKIDKKDLENIHKFCIQKDKQRRRGSVTSKTSRTSKSSGGGSRGGLSTAQLEKLLEKQLALDDPSIMINSTDDGHTSASSTQNSSARFKAVGPPLMIDMSRRSNHNDEVSVMCDPSVAPTPRTVDC